MPQIVCNIALDVSASCAEQTVSARQGDSQSRLLCVTLTDCGKPLAVERTAVVLLNVAYKEDCACFEGTITEEGRALFVLPDFVLAEAGKAKCDVSVIGAYGRLTTAPFYVSVEAPVCATDVISNDTVVADLAADFISAQRLVKLTPKESADGFLLSPEVNRKYILDLSDGGYAPNGVWKAMHLTLPKPTSTVKENWVLIYCHAPVTAETGAVQITFDENCLLADGVEPSITMSDFDLICTYSVGAAAWQIGVVQYSKKG